MRYLFVMMFFLSSIYSLNAQKNFQTDIFKTSAGDLKITFIGHGTLLFEFRDMVIHIDPVGRYADYSKLPKADIILITHEHGDHLDPKAIGLIKKNDTKLYCNEASLQTANGGSILRNGDSVSFKGVNISAVPAYNIISKNGTGQVFHPKGAGNGYVLTFANVKIYVAGDTENVPEMMNLKGIDVAFLPMNLPYTMTPAMVVDAVKMFSPKILYPYHYGNTNVNELVELMKNIKDCELRIREMN